MIETSQTITDFQDCEQEHQEFSQNGIEDYMGTKEDIDRIRLLLNDGSLSPQSGIVNPNGVVSANYSLLYFDTALSQLYFNPTFGSDAGWLLVV